MLEHTDAAYGIEFPLHIPVVLQADLYWKPLAKRLGILLLPLRDRDSRYFTAVIFGSEARQPSPPAPHIEKPHPGL
jgi:hypothetical protein